MFTLLTVYRLFYLITVNSRSLIFRSAFNGEPRFECGVCEFLWISLLNAQFSSSLVKNEIHIRVKDMQTAARVCAQRRLQCDDWRRENMGGAESRSPIRASVSLPVHSPLRWRKQWKPPLSMQTQMSCENPHARSSNRTTQPSDHRSDPQAVVCYFQSCLHALECFCTDIKLFNGRPI